MRDGTFVPGIIGSDVPARRDNSLKRYFSPQDWEYLNSNGTFKRFLDNEVQVERNFKSMVELGQALLKNRELAANRSFFQR